MPVRAKAYSLPRLTSSGPSHAAFKAGVIRWMGVSIVRVDLPQMKPDGQKGGKRPGRPNCRRRRGSRGRRTGRARGGKPRLLARAAARESAKKPGPVKKGTRASRLAKGRIKRANWIEGRFSFIGNELKRQMEQGNWFHQTDGTLREALPRAPERVRALFWLRLKQLSDNLRRKAFPCGPYGGRKPDTWGWFRRFWEVKYGTWEDVSWLGFAGDSAVGPFGRLSDGFHMYPRHVLDYSREEDLEVDSRPVPGDRLTSRQRVNLHRSNAQRRAGNSRLTSEDGNVLRGEERRRERERIRGLFRGSPRRPT